MHMRKLKYLILVLIVFSYSLSASVAYTSDVYYPAKVKDVSDRSYEKEVINLIDNSKDSIILSMYIVKPGDNKKHTVNRLLIDLEEALDRGVKVTLYLNTKVDERDYKPEDVGRGTCFDVLRKIVFKQIVLSQLLESLKPLDFDETKTKKIAVEILKRRIFALE